MTRHLPFSLLPFPPALSLALPLSDIGKIQNGTLPPCTWSTHHQVYVLTSVLICVLIYVQYSYIYILLYLQYSACVLTTLEKVADWKHIHSRPTSPIWLQGEMPALRLSSVTSSNSYQYLEILQCLQYLSPVSPMSPMSPMSLMSLMSLMSQKRSEVVVK